MPRQATRSRSATAPPRARSCSTRATPRRRERSSNPRRERAGAHATQLPRRLLQVNAERASPSALVERFAVIGSEAGAARRDRHDAGRPLARRARAATRSCSPPPPPSALAHVYVQPRRGRQAAPPAPAHRKGSRACSGCSPAAARRTSRWSRPPARSHSTSTRLAPADEHGRRPALGRSAEAAQALAELPGESWLAIGLGDVGKSLAGDVEGLRALGALAGGSGPSGALAPASSTLSIKSLLEGLLAPLNALGAPTPPQAKRDFTSWMGSAGIFAGGGGLLELKGAVVIESTDPARSRAAVASARGAAAQGAATRSSPPSIPGTDAAVGARIAGLPVVALHRRRARLERPHEVRARPRRSIGRQRR